uniref:PAP-associated domain-containing protein n=1 Tax=Rhabditophanes sp. KR3021 TaxID=114890 RepID=A0AC35U155_9BILA
MSNQTKLKKEDSNNKNKLNEKATSSSNEKPVTEPSLHENSQNAGNRTGLPDIETRTTISRMDVLSEFICDNYLSQSQTYAQLNKKLCLRDFMYYTICRMFPQCSLYIVGSSLNGFGNKASDMDLCLIVKEIAAMDSRRNDTHVDPRTNVVDKFTGIGLVNNLHLIVAKVPILRITFKEPFQDITVDLNANNPNTYLLAAYSNCTLVRPLVFAVKEWAKRRKMNDANKSTFTSYSLVLMCIHYLQTGGDQKILPSLQERYPHKFNQKDIRFLSVAVSLELPPEKEWKSQSNASLSQLLVGFLKYYAEEFDFDKDAISIRMGTKVTREQLSKYTSQYKSQWNCVCIEEPFLLLNTAHSVFDVKVFRAIKNCFINSYKELNENRDFASFLNGPTILNEVGNYIIIPPGGVQYNYPKQGSNIYSRSTDMESTDDDTQKSSTDEESKSECENVSSDSGIDR